MIYKILADTYNDIDRLAIIKRRENSEFGGSIETFYCNSYSIPITATTSTSN